jgi:hypothetical protein
MPLTQLQPIRVTPGRAVQDGLPRSTNVACHVTLRRQFLALDKAGSRRQAETASLLTRPWRNQIAGAGGDHRDGPSGFDRLPL